MTYLSTDDWERFRYDVKKKNRYIFHSSLKPPKNDQFLEALLQLAQAYGRFLTLETGTTLWRAQLDGTPYQPPPDYITKGVSMRAFLKPHDYGRMIPYSDKAKEGRVNPKGIPCLYTATTPQIALSEMKPMIGSYLTLAEFVTVRKLTVVDFASDPIELASDDPTNEEMDLMCWKASTTLFYNR